jgi:hypothetical protein
MKKSLLALLALLCVVVIVLLGTYHAAEGSLHRERQKSRD